MSQLQIQQVMEVTPWQSPGGTMYAYRIAGLLDNVIVTNAQINAKTADRYAAGQTVDVIIDKTDAYGVKLKKAPAPGFGSPPQAPAAAAPIQSYAGPISSVPYSDLNASLIDPRQNSIERQSCLAQAVAYCSAKAAAYQAAKKPDEALKELTGEHILQVAQYFKKFVENGFKAKERTVEDIQAEPLPEEDPFADSEEYL